MAVERVRELGVDVGVGRGKAIRRVVGGFRVYFLVIVFCTCSVCFGTRFSPEKKYCYLIISMHLEHHNEINCNNARN